MELYDRRWQVTVGSIDVSTLDLTFDVVKTTKREPNTATVTIANLAPASRAAVSGAARISVRAGYKSADLPPLLFVGDIRRVTHQYEAGTYTTTIEARDSGRAYSTARIAKSYAPGTPIARILADLAEALEVGRGNLDDFATTARLAGVDTVPEGFVAFGPASRVLSDVLRGAGLRWSVQNGALQIQRLRAPLRVGAERLAPETGLIGSPTQGDKGKVSARALLRPNLDPGRPVRLEAANVTGDFEVRAVKYTGETQGLAWYAELDLKRVET